MSYPVSEKELAEIRLLFLGLQAGLATLSLSMLQNLTSALNAEANQIYATNHSLQPNLPSGQEPPKNSPQL